MKKIALVKYEKFFLFISLSFFLFISYFIFFCLFSLPFPFLLFFFFFSFSPFNPYPCILIITLFFAHLFCFPSENHKKRRLKTKHLEDERKHHQRPFISFFSRFCYGWGADGGHGGCSPAAWQRHYRR